jgi:hypothetical protein
MKSVFAILLLAISLGFAQNRTKVSVDPVPLFVIGSNNMQFERTFLDGRLGWAFLFSQPGNAVRMIDGYRYYLSEQALTGKYYFFGAARSGPWAGGAVSVASGNIYEGEFILTENNARNIGTLGFYAMGGWQWTLGRFFLEPYSGIGVAATNDLYGNAQYNGDLEESRLLIKYGAQTGMSF